MKWKTLPTKLAITLTFMLISLHGISQLVTAADKSPNYKINKGGEKNESFEVAFALVGGNGSIDAYITNYGHINSGDSIEQGTDIRFEVYPEWNYIVKEWRVNDVIVEDNINNVFIYSNIQTSIVVTVELKKYVEPSITPERQYYALDDPNNVTFTINWGSETEVTKIVREYEDELGEHQQQNLTEGTDYSITGDVLTVYNSYIESLSPEASSGLYLEIEFKTGIMVWFEIRIIQTERAQVSPTDLTYDLSNPGDVMTTILWGTTAKVVELISSVAKSNLVEETDYHIDGAWLYLHNSYLTQELTTAGDELNLNVLFDNGDEVLLNVVTIKSGITNATINPTSISFYQYEFPEYVDITITWNDATSVTNMHVLVSIEQESEQMDWPFYEVTDNGDGTAKLRINFDEVNKSNSSAAKKEELSYVTLTINFDVGAPALFLMTIIDEYYDVIVTIDPIDAGWVNGQSDYSPGDTVELSASPNTGYVFLSWKDGVTGDVVSFENPYIFNMPGEAVKLVAHFVPEQNLTVTYSVIGANGTLTCEADGAAITSGDNVMIASKLVFTANPEAGYRVKEWVLNNVVVENATDASFIIEATSAPVNLTVEFETIPTKYTVTFAVTAGNNPIEGATINFDGTNYTTNATGIATIADVEVGNYSYTVSMSGYTEVTGTVDVTNADVNEPVSLTPNSVETNEISTIRAYPNPFDSYITITNSEKVRRVVVTNLIGQKVMIFNSNGEATVNTSELRSGIYLITFEGQNGQSTIRKMIKK